jgi:hypothetical protein
MRPNTTDAPPLHENGENTGHVPVPTHGQEVDTFRSAQSWTQPHQLMAFSAPLQQSLYWGQQHQQQMYYQQQQLMPPPPPQPCVVESQQGSSQQQGGVKLDRQDSDIGSENSGITDDDDGEINMFTMDEEMDRHWRGNSGGGQHNYSI